MKGWTDALAEIGSFRLFDVGLLESGNITNFSLYLKTSDALILVAHKPHQWGPEEIDTIKTSATSLLYPAQDEHEAQLFLRLKELAWGHIPVGILT